MVAKSYQKMKQLGVPFNENGKAYVWVQGDTGPRRKVRWYTDSEYAKMYPEENKMSDTTSKYYRPQKYTLGFDKGYITIFRGITEEHEEWFRQSICRFAVPWGWYVVSTQEVPADLPSGVKPVRLDWEPMGREDEWLKEESVVKAHVRQTLLKAIAEVSTSKRQGNIGDRIDRSLKVIGKIESETKYGKTFVYDMRDLDGNYYKWKTSAKDWVVGSDHTIRGTIKEYEEVNGEEATVLTRCIENK